MGAGTGARQARGWSWNTSSLSNHYHDWQPSDHLIMMASSHWSFWLSWTMSLGHQREIIDWLSRFPSLEWDSCGLIEDCERTNSVSIFFPHWYYPKWTNILRMCSDIKSLEEANIFSIFSLMCYLLLEVDKHGEHTLSFHHTSPDNLQNSTKSWNFWPLDHVDYNSHVKGRNIAVKGKKGVEIGGTKKFSKVTRGWQGGANKYIENIKHKQKQK